MRALLEAICFQTRDVLEAMKADADLSELRAMFVDGGASQNSLLMQMQADILQVGLGGGTGRGAIGLTRCRQGRDCMLRKPATADAWN